MRSRLFVFLISVFLTIPMQVVVAKDIETEKISTLLKGIFPDAEITRIRKSPVSGLYEVMLGSEMMYVTENGRYLLRGDLFDIAQRRNLSEEQRSKTRSEILKKIPVSEMIEFKPNDVKHVVYVFTDIDCGYCRRLHRDVPALNNQGVAVRYLAFPRSGPGSMTFKHMESVWCATDRHQALSDAKFGKGVKPINCNNPVSSQYTLGKTLGVRGTPAIYLENGREIPGYMPPNKLLSILNEKQNIIDFN